MEKITQREAARRGLNRFYTGNPCRQGHDAERYVANAVCVECHRERNRRQQEEIRELRRQAGAKEASS